MKVCNVGIGMWCVCGYMGGYEVCVWVCEGMGGGLLRMWGDMWCRGVCGR